MMSQLQTSCEAPASYCTCAAAAPKKRTAWVTLRHGCRLLNVWMQKPKRRRAAAPADALLGRHSPQGCWARGPPRWCRLAPAPPAAGGT